MRDASVALCATLSPEDTVVQSMPDVSPTKWHLAHVTWFFERFILERSRKTSRHTLQHEVAHLRAFLRYAYDVGLVHKRLDGLDTRTRQLVLAATALPSGKVITTSATARSTEAPCPRSR